MLCGPIISSVAIGSLRGEGGAHDDKGETPSARQVGKHIPWRLLDAAKGLVRPLHLHSAWPSLLVSGCALSF